MDAARVPFKVQFEVKGDATKLSRALQKMAGWSASPCPGDCSHSKFMGDGGNGAFARVNSPDLTIETNGLDQFERALQAVRSAGGKLSKSAAMRFYVPKTILDKEATGRFFQMLAANEDALYTIGCNGGTGRPLPHKLSYAQSVARLVPHQNRTTWETTFNNHTYGVNGRNGPSWELRFFDTSYNLDAVRASAELVCGMAAAAVEGRGQWHEVNPAQTSRPSVERQRWNAFMRDTVSPSTSRRLQTYFVNAGGKLTGPATSPATEHAVAQMISRHYSFTTADGHAFADPTHAADAIATKQAVGVVDPNGDRVPLSPAQVEPFTWAANLQYNGVEFHIKAASGSPQQPLPRAADVADRALNGRPTRARLPRWTIVRWLPVKNYTIRTPRDLERLARKLG